MTPKSPFGEGDLLKRINPNSIKVGPAETARMPMSRNPREFGWSNNNVTRLCSIEAFAEQARIPEDLAVAQRFSTIKSTKFLVESH
jgi:hypothetical protein